VSGTVVVIGAGACGLVAAQRLARAGRRVVVLERKAKGDGERPDVGWVPQIVSRDLGLWARGLRVWRANPWASVALEAGGRLELWADPARSAEAIRRVSPKDAARWPAFAERMHRLSRLLEALYVAPPPDLLGRGGSELLRLARLGWRVRGLGRQGMVDLLRTLPMSVAELLDDWFENQALKAAVGTAGVLNLAQGPRSGGTAFQMLHHAVGSPAGVFRPPLSNLTQVLSELPGVELRRGATVSRISVSDGRATGVVLQSGEEIPASAVVSGADPRATLLKLVEPAWLDAEHVRALRGIRCRGVAAAVRLVLDREPGFATLTVAPSLEYLEKAWDEAKHGGISRRPFLEARAEGRVLEVHLQYAPYHLTGGWSDARKGDLGDLAAASLDSESPGLAAAAVERTVRTPQDLETELGWPEGHAYHGELALDQILFMRPIPSCARYRTPIAGLYLTGPGTHPGGAVAGAAGALAADAVIRDSASGLAG
jgi:phytoene dehydrogenase-like protein